MDLVLTRGLVGRNMGGLSRYMRGLENMDLVLTAGLVAGLPDSS